MNSGQMTISHKCAILLMKTFFVCTSLLAYNASTDHYKPCAFKPTGVSIKL